MRNDEEALQHYNRAIQMDAELTAAYFNRGTVFIALSKKDLAIKDFNKTIELDNNFVRAYYSRASVLVDMNQYPDAIRDLNKVLELKPQYPNALVLRGNLRIAEDDQAGGCSDFQRALELGSRSAARLLINNCEFDSTMMETVRLDWFKGDVWKLTDANNNDEMIVREYLRHDESYENWTELGTMQTILGMNHLGIKNYMDVIYDQAKKNCDQINSEVIENQPDAEYPWAIFSIECFEPADGSDSQYQIWHIIQGEESLYTNFWITKNPKPDPAEINRWVNFFKTATVINYLKKS